MKQELKPAEFISASMPKCSAMSRRVSRKRNLLIMLVVVAGEEDHSKDVEIPMEANLGAKVDWAE